MEQLLRNIYKFFLRIDAGVTVSDKFLEEFPSESWDINVNQDSLEALNFYIRLIYKKWETYSIEDFEFLKDWDYKVVGTTDHYICTLSKVLCEIVEPQPTVNIPARIEPARLKFESAETLTKELFLSDKEISKLKVEITIKDLETLVRQSGRLGVDPLVSILWTFIQNQEKQKLQSERT